MEKIVGKTRYIFSVGAIENSEVDVLFLWTTATLNSGDITFIRTHKEAGSVLQEYCLKSLMKYGKKDFEGTYSIPVGQSIITHAGKLNCYNVIHCALPNYRIVAQRNSKREVLMNSVKMSVELAKAFGDLDNPLNTAAIPPIPTLIYGDVDDSTIKDFFLPLIHASGFKKVRLVFETEEEMKRYEKVFFKLTTPLYERILNKIFKFEF